MIILKQKLYVLSQSEDEKAPGFCSLNKEEIHIFYEMAISRKSARVFRGRTCLNWTPAYKWPCLNCQLDKQITAAVGPGSAVKSHFGQIYNILALFPRVKIK